MATQPLAIQLYSLRDAFAAQGARPILTRLAEIGYAGAEYFGGLDATETVALCQELNLKITSAHLPPPVGDQESATLKTAETLGIQRIVVPWIDQEKFTTVDGIQEVCELLNQANEVARRNGFELGYHNHWGELAVVDGRPALERMLDQLDPTVFFEVDAYWVKVGGQDPVAIVQALGSRVPLLHVKDGPADGREAAMLAVGQGNLDYAAIIGAASAADWLIVELDRCATDMLTAVEQSYQYLTEKGLGHGTK